MNGLVRAAPHKLTQAMIAMGIAWRISYGLVEPISSELHSALKASK
jgi:hypothetical protein